MINLKIIMNNSDANDADDKPPLMQPAPLARCLTTCSMGTGPAARFILTNGSYCHDQQQQPQPRHG